jgi:hypothetical protein
VFLVVLLLLPALAEALKLGSEALAGGLLSGLLARFALTAEKLLGEVAACSVALGVALCVALAALLLR